MSKPPRRILPTIVLAQFCCTSLWFAGNAVLTDLQAVFSLTDAALGYLTSAVQMGFICGTLAFAVLSVADRYSPTTVFCLAAIMGALCNLGVLLPGLALPGLLMCRFGVGICLAGIYPVGMKIASDYYAAGLGRSLGYLVGALVLGTAFPHLLSGLELSLGWQSVLLTTSGLALLGGLGLRVLVPDGPLREAPSEKDWSAFFRVFRQPNFRAAASGYFGHMWELYAFWAFVPVLLLRFSAAGINVAWWSFAVIGIGGVGCVLGGYLSRKLGTGRVAFGALLGSGLCCLLSPWLLPLGTLVVLPFLLLWGLLVVADSPLFSTLVAGEAPPAARGTALTIVNCIGFAITIGSIQLLTMLLVTWPTNYLPLLLLPGPLLGLLALWRRRQGLLGAPG